MADLDAALMQKVLDVPPHHRQRMISGLVLNHLNGLSWVMARGYRIPLPRLKPVSSDTARYRAGLLWFPSFPNFFVV